MIKNTFREIIRDHIERAALGKAGMPNWNRAKFLAALDVSRPSSSGMPPGLTPPGRLTLEHQSSRDFSFGRVQTLADESIEWLTARRSAERLGTLGSSGRSMERLSRDSTTTLGTMGSNGSRESNARSRVSEGGRRSPGNNSQFGEYISNDFS